MHRKSRFWYKFAVLFMALVLLVPILVACGSEDEEETTSTPPSTATTTATVTATPTPTTSTEPVKIGVINAWSGAAAVSGLLCDPVIDLVQEQVNKAGGILGGRPLKIIKYDNRSLLSGSTAGVIKLVLQDNVAAIAFGGTTVPELMATSEAAEEYQVLYSCYAPIEGLEQKNKYTVVTAFSNESLTETIMDFVLEVIKPTRVAVLAELGTQPDLDIAFFENKAKLAGVQLKFVYSNKSIPLDTMDYSPYLTKAKYNKPDLLLLSAPRESTYGAIYKQATELGGWGEGTTVVSYSPVGASTRVRKLPAAEGTYTWTMWAPGVSGPGSKAFEEAYIGKYGKIPDPNHVFFYNSLWTAIKAIELAGTTDHQEVARVARSGELKWDMPGGTAVFGPDGNANLRGYMLHIGKRGEFTEIKW